MSTIDYTSRIDELPERFRTKFEVWDTGFDTPCWIWRAAKTYNGYGIYGVGSKTERAHRYAYTMLVGPIPEGLVLDHSFVCTNPSCVNPGHVEVTTRGINALRGDSPPSRNARKTHCPKGHEYNSENTVIRHGNRGCKICQSDRNSSNNPVYYANNKAAILEQCKQYRHDHKEQIARYKAEWYKRRKAG